MTVNRKVRFEEVDALGIVWHGRYSSYLEDGRVAFGEKYGLGYMEMYRARILAPIVQFHVDFHKPLRFSQEFSITAALCWSEAARLNFQYRVTTLEGSIIATGYTVQLLTNPEGEVFLTMPDVFVDFKHKWRNNLLK